MFPLQSTPLPQRATSAAAAAVPPAAYDPNVTFEVPDGEDQAAADSRSSVPAGVSPWRGSEPGGPHLSMAVGSVQGAGRGCDTLVFCRCCKVFSSMAWFTLLCILCKFAANCNARFFFFFYIYIYVLCLPLYSMDILCD